MTTAVECGGVIKGFRSGASDVLALRGVDLRVEERALHMIVGPSGCGKTTLISIIAGILHQDSGTCSVFGAQINDLPRSHRTRFRGESVGFVFQSFNLIPTLTAAENVAIPLLLNTTKRRDALARAAELLERVGLGNKQMSRTSQLSGGEQQRVAIARALVHRPRLVVCDEPTSALDHENGMKVLRLFKELAEEQGVTTIVVSHDARVYSFASCISRMDDGRVVEEMNRDEILRRYGEPE